MLHLAVIRLILFAYLWFSEVTVLLTIYTYLTSLPLENQKEVIENPYKFQLSLMPWKMSTSNLLHPSLYLLTHLHALIL